MLRFQAIFRQCTPILHRRYVAMGSRAAATGAGPLVDTFRAADLVVERSQRQPPASLPEELPFGRTFSDHMLLVEHTTGRGWSAPRIVPFGPLQLHPAAQVLHYGMTCFEGMKAYAGADGRGRLFRPDMNMARLLRSARRLLLAEFDTQELLACLMALLRVDRAWLPTRPGHSLYIRPFAFGSEGALGVHASSSTTLAVILSPVGPYFSSGPTAVRLFLDSSNVRAWPGGAGAHKVMYCLPCGDDPGDALLSECGAMNLFFVFKRSSSSAHSSGGSDGTTQIEVVTPPLDGTILPGVTRDSALQLLRGRSDVLVSERPLRVRELLAASDAGQLVEVFGCGTACVVQPVRAIVTQDGVELALPHAGEAAATTQGAGSSTGIAAWLRDRLTAIQHGRESDHPWSVPFE